MVVGKATTSAGRTQNRAYLWIAFLYFEKSGVMRVMYGNRDCNSFTRPGLTGEGMPREISQVGQWRLGIRE